MKDDRKEIALERICIAAEKAVANRQGEEYNSLIRRFIDCVKNELIYYLCPDYDRVLRGATVTPEHFETANEVYTEIISNSKELFDLIENYDPTLANNGFEGYFRNIISKKRKKYEKVFQNENARTGVTDVFSDREAATLRRILKMCENYDIDNLSADAMDKICEALNIKRENLSALLFRNRNSGSTHSEKNELDNAMLDFISDGNGRVHKATTKPESVENDNGFEEFLLQLNEIYKIFPENVKEVYPHGFTGLFIEKRCDTIKEKHGFSGKDKVVEQAFDEMLLPDYCEYYANGKYICISRRVFVHSIENRIVMLGKDVAEFLGISSGQYSKLMSKGQEIVAQMYN